VPSAQPENEKQTEESAQNVSNDELISRKAAIDALADYIHNVDKVLGAGKLSAYDCKDAARSVLGELPSAQPEIIRCKDCEHWDTTWQNDFAPNYHYCPVIDGTHRDDFYCADAERRSGQDD
jgi:hypothetical protein